MHSLLSKHLATDVSDVGVWGTIIITHISQLRVNPIAAQKLDSDQEEEQDLPSSYNIIFIGDFCTTDQLQHDDETNLSFAVHRSHAAGNYICVSLSLHCFAPLYHYLSLIHI